MIVWSKKRELKNTIGTSGNFIVKLSKTGLMYSKLYLFGFDKRLRCGAGRGERQRCRASEGGGNK